MEAKKMAFAIDMSEVVLLQPSKEHRHTPTFWTNCTDSGRSSVTENGGQENETARFHGVSAAGFGIGDRIGPQARMPRAAKLVVLVKP